MANPDLTDIACVEVRGETRTEMLEQARQKFAAFLGIQHVGKKKFIIRLGQACCPNQADPTQWQAMATLRLKPGHDLYGYTDKDIPEGPHSQEGKDWGED